MNLVPHKSVASRRKRRGLAAGFSVLAALLVALPGAARLLPLGETVFPESPDNGFIGLAPLAGRGVVIAWLDEGQRVLRARELEEDLLERRSFDVADSRGGPPTLLFCPQIARIGQGRLVFAWAELNESNLLFRVAYRVMHEDGTPRSPIRYAQDQVLRLSEECPHLSGGDTGFVIAWNLALGPIGPSSRLRARTFSLRGAPTSPPIDLAISVGSTSSPDVLVDRTGGFVASWVVNRGGNEGNELMLGRFGRDGKPIGRPVRVAAPAQELIAFTADAQSGSELFWITRDADRRHMLLGRRFDRNLRPISPVRTVFVGNDSQPLIPTAAVDRKGRTALVVANGGILYGLELDPSLDSRRCGAMLRVNDDLPQGFFPIVTSAPGEVVIAGIEADGASLPKLIVRRYRVGACGAPPS